MSRDNPGLNVVQMHKDEHQSLGLTHDDDGNLIGSVQLRTDTLEGLLAVTDAADGELAIATDDDVIVRYLGDPSETKMYGAGAPIYSVHLAPDVGAGGTADAITGTLTPVVFNVLEDTKGIYDDVNQVFILPKIDGLLPRWVKIHAQFTGSGSGGTYRYAALQREIIPGTFVTVLSGLTPAPLNVNEPASVVLLENDFRSQPANHDGKNFQIAVQQDSGGTLTAFGVYVTIEFGF